MHSGPKGIWRVKERIRKIRVHGLLLSLVSSVESNLLAVCNEARVDIAELSLKALLLDGEASERATEAGKKETRENEVAQHHSGSLDSNSSSQFAWEDDDIEDGFAQVREQLIEFKNVIRNNGMEVVPQWY